MESTSQPVQFSSNRISISDWVISIFIVSLPLVGIVMLFVCGFSGNIPETKANWAKAMLVWYLVMIIFGGIFMAIFGSIFFGRDTYQF